MLGGTMDENEAGEATERKYNVYGLTNWSAETLPIAKSATTSLMTWTGSWSRGGEVD